MWYTWYIYVINDNRWSNLISIHVCFLSKSGSLGLGLLVVIYPFFAPADVCVCFVLLEAQQCVITRLITKKFLFQDLLPLVFMFELPILQALPDVSSSPAIQQIQQSHNVNVTFKQRPNVYVTTVIVRGSVNNAKSVKEATMMLIEHLTGNIAVSFRNMGTWMRAGTWQIGKCAHSF